MWAALAAAGLASAEAAAAVKPKVVKRTIGSASLPVPRSFAGFSIEYPSAGDYFGQPGKPNQSFIQLLRTLGDGGAGAPTIRMGGNSGDETWWNPDGRAQPPGVETDITPAFISTLRPLAEAGAPLVLGGNFAIADPGNAVGYVQAAVAGLPVGSIESFEIGNEADLYDRPAIFHVGNRTLIRPQRRPAGYSVPLYLAELDQYLAALNAVRTPQWPAVAVGGFARHAWQVEAPAVLAHVGVSARYFQQHGYPLNRCRTPRAPATRWRKALLEPTGSLTVGRARRLVQTVRRFGAKVRVSEINSATCGGAQGVSDSFASALWGADVLFGMAEARVVGVNFHTWSGAWYAPVSFAGGVPKVRPLLYGMLLFTRAMRNGARLLRVEQLRSDEVKVWATRDASGIVRVAVINKDWRRAQKVALKLPRGVGSGRIERLLAGKLSSRTGVTFAGQSFDRPAFDGTLQGRRRSTRVKRRGRIFKFRLPAASAALLTARPR